jgi:hypothetical protein
MNFSIMQPPYDFWSQYIIIHKKRNKQFVNSGGKEIDDSKLTPVLRTVEKKVFDRHTTA